MEKMGRVKVNAEVGMRKSEKPIKKRKVNAEVVKTDKKAQDECGSRHGRLFSYSKLVQIHEMF